MRFNAFGLSLVGCLVLALSASAATVSMTRTANVNRPQAQGAGNYDVYDFLWTNADGAEFTNYTVTGTTTSGSFFDPARLQDDRQINPAAAAEGNTAGAVDMWANTVWSSAGKTDLGLTSTILPDPGGYSPTGSGASPAFTNFKWDVFDNVQGDDNDLNNDAANPTAAAAPYHIMRVLTAPNSVGTINFLAYDTSQPGVPFSFDFNITGDTVQNTAPSIVSPAATGGVAQGAVLNGDFNATDVETPGGPFTFSGLTLASFVPSHGGSNPAGLFAASASLNASSGVVNWNTTGFARGVYDITVNVADQGPGAPMSAGNNPGHWLVTITTVPEPSSLALLGLAMVGALGFRRRNG